MLLGDFMIILVVFWRLLFKQVQILNSFDVFDRFV